MISKSFTIPVTEKESISIVLSIPDPFESGTAVIVAHGAGNDMNNSLIVSFCENLANAGYLAVRFNFPYKEHQRRVPDRREILERTWKRVFHFVRDKAGYSVGNLFMSGKSMGGRIASQMLADGTLNSDGIIFLGYPLHPAGNKDKLRDEHLPLIKIPMLFFVGTRDNLCDLSLMKMVIQRLGPKAELEVVEGGDHSFKIPKSASSTIQQVYERIANKSIEWMRRNSQDEGI